MRNSDKYMEDSYEYVSSIKNWIMADWCFLVRNLTRETLIGSLRKLKAGKSSKKWLSRAMTCKTCQRLKCLKNLSLETL